MIVTIGILAGLALSLLIIEFSNYLFKNRVK